MREDDLDKGLQNIKDILLRLETQAHEARLLKEFPRPVHTEPPAEEPGPGPQPVPQAPEPSAVSEPELEAVKAEPSAVPPAEEPKPELLSVPQVPAPPVISAPAADILKRTSGTKVKTLVFFCLGLAAAAAVYQFGFNSSGYRFKQASKFDRTGDKTRAVAAYERLILKYPGTADAAASLYSIGNILNERSDPGAVEYYRKFLGMASAGDLRVPDAKFKIAESRFKDGAVPEAVKWYEDADVLESVYAQKARERLDQIKAAETQAAEAQKQLAAEAARTAAKAAAAAKAKLARRILVTNREHLAARAANKATAVKVFSLNERYAVCSAVWLAEQQQVKPDAGPGSAKKKYDCDALKASLAVCEGSREKTAAIKTRSAEERAARVQSVVKDWTVQKQESLDKKMLNLYDENRCAELLEISSQGGEEEAPEGF